MQLEVHRYGIFDANGFSPLLAGFPVGHGLDDAYGLLVEGGVSTGAYHFDINDGAVLVDDELADDTSLDTVLLCDNGVFDVLAEVFE